MRRWPVLLTILLVGCSESKQPCGGKVLLLWPSAAGEYQPSVVETPTLKDPRRLSGPAAKIYFESRPNKGGFSGQIAEPHMTNSGDVCVPTDAGSAVAASAYAQFERLYAFDQKLGVADQLTWPRKVGVETKINGQAGDVQNNAHYMGEKDLVILVPSTVDGVPVAMNLGVVAHEHFHAHFQSQVLNALAIASTTHAVVSLMPKFITDLVNGGGDDPTRQANDFTLRGWNEGLADLYAAVYLKQPDFLAASFGRGAAAQARMLNGPLATLGTHEIAARVNEMSAAQGSGKDELRQTLIGLAYGQGVALARVLWAVVNAEEGLSPEDSLAKIMKSLDQVPRALNEKVNATELKSSFILPILLRDFKLSPTACARISDAIPASEPLPRITQCESF